MPGGEGQASTQDFEGDECSAAGYHPHSIMDEQSYPPFPLDEKNGPARVRTIHHRPEEQHAEGLEGEADAQPKQGSSRTTRA